MLKPHVPDPRLANLRLMEDADAWGMFLRSLVPASHHRLLMERIELDRSADERKETTHD